MKDDKKPHDFFQTGTPLQIHRLPVDARSGVLRKYGLRIVGGSDSLRTAPDSFADCPLRFFEFYSFSHMYAGKGHLWIAPDQERDLLPGDGVLITPGTVNRYGGWSGECYFEDSIQFCGPIADMLHNAGMLRDGVVPMGGARRLLGILKSLRNPALTSQLQAALDLQKLLLDLDLSVRKKSGNAGQLDALLKLLPENLQNWWSVSEMAEFCRLSDDQFRRVFVAATGLQPKAYLDALKMRRAAEMLGASRLPIHKIAAALGYQDPYHFSRRFKECTGQSPQAYRDTQPLLPDQRFPTELP